MNHFKNNAGEVFAFDDKQVSDGLADGLTPITLSEKDSLLAPTQAQLTQNKITEIKARLHEIDLESVRPLRATLNQTQTQADTDKLMTLDTEAEQLRTELAGL